MKLRLAPLALAALAVAAAPTAMAAPNLVKVGDTGAVSVYVDKESIRRTGAQARAAVEWRYAKPTSLPDNPAKSYRLERQVQVANCDNRSWAVAEGTQYADERGLDPVGSYKNDETTLPFTVAPARTIRDAVVVFVCAAVPTPAAPATPAKKP